FFTFKSSLRADYIYLNSMNLPPQVTQVEALGEMIVGGEISVSYTFQDPEGDEDQSSFQWFRADDLAGSNNSRIEGADSQIYSILDGDLGKYLRLEITPSDGLKEGKMVQSKWFGPVALPL